MSSQLKAMSMKMSTMTSYQEIVKSLQGSSTVLAKMNEQMDIQSIQQVLKNFQKESMKAEFQQEAVSSTKIKIIIGFITLIIVMFWHNLISDSRQSRSQKLDCNILNKFDQYSIG
jgi:hypothetical protein